MKKRTKVVFATIAVAGYMGSKKVTNTLNWRVFLIDEKDPDGLIEKERQKVLTAVIDGAKRVSNAVEFRAKITEKEVRLVDTFLTAEPEKIGKTGQVKGTLKLK